MDWIEIGSVHDVPRLGARCVETPGGRVGVFRTADDQVYALENRCPHRGGPLTEGIVHGQSVSCPLHNWSISLITGRAEGADEGRTPTWPVRVEGSRVFLGLAAPTQSEAGADGSDVEGSDVDVPETAASGAAASGAAVSGSDMVAAS